MIQTKLFRILKVKSGTSLAKWVFLGFLLSLSMPDVFAEGKLTTVTPGAVAAGVNVRLSINGDSTAFATSLPEWNVLEVSLAQMQTVIPADTFETINDSLVEAEFTIPLAVPLGLYDVEVRTNSIGLLKLEGGLLITLTHIEERDVSESISIYPNPARDFVRIRRPAGNHENYQVDLFNIRGAMLRSQELRVDGRLNISDLPPGVYFIQIRRDTHPVRVLKLIKPSF